MRFFRCLSFVVVALFVVSARGIIGQEPVTEKDETAGSVPEELEGEGNSPEDATSKVFTTDRGDFTRAADNKTLLTPQGKQYVHRRKIIDVRTYAAFVYLVDDWGVYRYEPSEDTAPDLPPSRYNKIFTEIYTTPRHCALQPVVINWGKQHYYVLYHYPKNVNEPKAPRKRIFRGLLRCYERTDNTVAIQYIPYFGLSETENWLLTHAKGDRNMLTLTIRHQGEDVPYLLRLTPGDDFLPPVQ